MHAGHGQVIELSSEGGNTQARIACPANLIPAPGQYLLAGSASPLDPLPVPLFSTESTPFGFTAAPPVPSAWMPGTNLSLRGPLGRGFTLPHTARKVALIPFDDDASRLRGLMVPSLNQGAAVVLLGDSDMGNLPDAVEVQPFTALEEVLAWAEYAAFDVLRESLPGLSKRLGGSNWAAAGKEAQVLVQTPIPCGGIGECAVCAVTFKSGWKLACKEGPVFDWEEVFA
ncbi:MAG: hypothetical protein HXY42_12745 [Chloroflexi bacterium]|nr:hypothetical protein [Chloroflexota bacterium]